MGANLEYHPSPHYRETYDFTLQIIAESYTQMAICIHAGMQRRAKGEVSVESLRFPKSKKEILPSFRMLVLKLIAACSALIGLALLRVPIVLYRKARQTCNWPSARGTILSAEIVEGMDTEDGKSYQTKILYEYSVNNATFTSDVLWPGCSKRCYNMGSAQQIRDRYYAGMAVPVFFNPEKPDDAVLARGEWERAPLWIGLFLIAFGFFHWLISLNMTVISTDVDW